MSAKKKLLSRPVLAGLVVVVLIGSVVGWRASQAGKDQPKKAPDKVVLEFTPADVATVEMRLGRVGHKPLRASGIFSGKCHSYSPALVRSFIDLATNLVSWTTIPFAARISILNNEIGHHAMDHDSIEVATFRQANKVVDSQRR